MHENIRERLRANQIILGALGMGVFIAGIVFATVAPAGDATADFAEIFFYIVAGTTVLTIAIAYQVQQSVGPLLAAAGSAEEALEIVFRRNIISAAVMEASALLALVGFLLTGDSTFVLFVVPFFVTLAVLFPTPQRLEARIGAAIR